MYITDDCHSNIIHEALSYIECMPFSHLSKDYFLYFVSHICHFWVVPKLVKCKKFPIIFWTWKKIM